MHCVKEDYHLCSVTGHYIIFHCSELRIGSVNINMHKIADIGMYVTVIAYPLKVPACPPQDQIPAIQYKVSGQGGKDERDNFKF